LIVPSGPFYAPLSHQNAPPIWGRLIFAVGFALMPKEAISNVPVSETISK
jgi:hypothetical protein